MDIKEFLALPRESQRRAIKHQVYDTVPPGEVKETAAAAGLEDYTLYKMRDETRENHDLLRPELLAIMHHRGDLRLVHWILGLFGESAFPLPKAKVPPGEMAGEIARTIRSFGEHLQLLTFALEGDSPGGAALTPEEYRQVVQTADATISRLTLIKEAARLARDGKAAVKEVPMRFGGRGEA